jgi:peptidoglycan hydrolase-like protein with peptidoglycan-binding domain
MMRAIVLVLCLASAGAIALYTQYSSGETGEPVYTVPLRPSDSAPRAPTPAAPKPIDPSDRAALTRELQRELRRVGCYNGEVTGAWTASSRQAMKTFVERVNATLPVDTPDPVLLSLVQGHRDRACNAACPAGQTADKGGACVPNAVLAKGTKEAPDGKSDSDNKLGAALPAAGTAAALALGTPGSRPQTNPKPDPKPDPKAAPAPGVMRPAAADPGGPVPPEGMVRERRPRRSAEPSAQSPPKFVNDILKTLGLK